MTYIYNLYDTLYSSLRRAVVRVQRRSECLESYTAETLDNKSRSAPGSRHRTFCRSVVENVKKKHTHAHKVSGRGPLTCLRGMAHRPRPTSLGSFFFSSSAPAPVQKLKTRYGVLFFPDGGPAIGQSHTGALLRRWAASLSGTCRRLQRSLCDTCASFLAAAPPANTQRRPMRVHHTRGAGAVGVYQGLHGILCPVPRSQQPAGGPFFFWCLVFHPRRNERRLEGGGGGGTGRVCAAAAVAPLVMSMTTRITRSL